MLKEGNTNETTLWIIKLFDANYKMDDNLRRKLYEKLNTLSIVHYNKVIKLLTELWKNKLDSNKKLFQDIQIISNQLEELQEKRSLI